jgi:sugar phosphate isomerase/epimerase
MEHAVMKKTFLVVAALSMMFTGTLFSQEAIKPNTHPSTEAYLGWRLGVQAWSFNRFSFYEAVDKTAALGLGYIEAYSNQGLDKKGSKVTMGHNMSASAMEKVKKKLADAGVKVVNYGVVNLPNNEAECRKVFDFAKDMGIETIVSEPKENALDMIYSLCQEYKIKVALHNHPKPSHYWNPDTVLAACKGRQDWIGACADTGHWLRSGLNPVECLKKLEGKIVSLHIKDIDIPEKKGHCVVWGTGKVGIKEVLAELDRQRFKGVFSIEYEYNWNNSMGDIYQSIQYFNKIAGELKTGGWRNLFADDLSNAVAKKNSWDYKMGVLTRKGGGDIWTKDKYGDFVLDFEFRLEKGTNSGVFLRAGEREWIPWAEVQVEDSYGKEISKHICGAIFDCLEPTVNAAKKPGQWNRMTIAAIKNKIIVSLNGQRVVRMDLNNWPTAKKNPDGTKNKFKIAYKDLPREGFIGLQDHGQKVWYRNVKIKEVVIPIMTMPSSGGLGN